MPRKLTTLSGIDRFQSGIGDGDDLRVLIREDPSGRWFPVIHKGYYYIGTEEGYLYASGAAKTITIPVSGQPHTLSVSGVVGDPTKYGPVQLVRKSDGLSLRRVTSPLRAYRPITFSGSGSVKSASVSGLVVSLVSHPTTGIYLSVPSTGDIVSVDDYVYDQRAGKLYIRDDNPPSLYVTYVTTRIDNPLRIEEIVRVDRDGKVRVQYTSVTSGAGYEPIIRKPTRTGTTTVTGTVVSGNVISLPGSGIVSGDIVAVEYTVDNSFAAYVSGGAIVVTAFVTVSGDYELRYETSQFNFFDTSQLPSDDPNRIQLNPVFDNRESGYLHLVDKDEPWPSVRHVDITVIPTNPLYSLDGSAPVKIAITFRDSELVPIPEATGTVTTSGASGTLTLEYPQDGRADGRGQLFYRFVPLATGSVTVIVETSGTTGTATFMVRDESEYYRTENQRLGKVLLNIEPMPVRDDLYRLNAYYCYPDGVAYQTHGGSGDWLAKISFKAGRSDLFHLDGRPYRPTDAEIQVGVDGIASLLIRPAPGDIVRAEVQTPEGGRYRTAFPVRTRD